MHRQAELSCSSLGVGPGYCCSEAGPDCSSLEFGLGCSYYAPAALGCNSLDVGCSYFAAELGYSSLEVGCSCFAVDLGYSFLEAGLGSVEDWRSFHPIVSFQSSRLQLCYTSH